jgi:hypothetical protein
MRHRVLLTHHSLAVVPLLELAAPSVSPCVTDLHCYNLRLQANSSKVRWCCYVRSTYSYADVIRCLFAGAQCCLNVHPFAAWQCLHISGSVTPRLQGSVPVTTKVAILAWIEFGETFCVRCPSFLRCRMLLVQCYCTKSAACLQERMQAGECAASAAAAAVTARALRHQAMQQQQQLVFSSL